MTMTPEQLAVIKTEVMAMPTIAKYANLTHAQIADKIRTQAGSVDRKEISGGLLVASIVRAELAGLSASDKAYLQLVCMCPAIPMTATLKKELGDIFPAESKTRANALALVKQSATLADQLGVSGITASDVADALRE